eukprot:4509083-Prymnesium_polylepis.1
MIERASVASEASGLSAGTSEEPKPTCLSALRAQRARARNSRSLHNSPAPQSGTAGGLRAAARPPRRPSASSYGRARATS